MFTIEEKIEVMDMDLYHATKHVSSSSLKGYATNPVMAYELSYYRKRTRSMDFGTKVHDMLTRQKDFTKAFLNEIPEVPKAVPKYVNEWREANPNLSDMHKEDPKGVEWKRLWLKWKHPNEEFLIADRRERENLKAIYKHFRSLPMAKKLVDLDDPNNEAETSYFGTYAPYALPVKCRPDFYAPRRSYVLDFKTFSNEDCSLRNFETECVKREYDMRAAFYLDFLGAENFIYCVVQTVPPFMVEFYLANNDHIESGRNYYKKAIENYVKVRQEKRENRYTSSNGLVSIGIPSYRLENSKLFIQGNSNE